MKNPGFKPKLIDPKFMDFYMMRCCLSKNGWERLDPFRFYLVIESGV